MSTISTVTDRVDGEVLTAAKYNADHAVHEGNSTNLNVGKVEISNYNTEHGPTGIHSPDSVRISIGVSTADNVRFRSVNVNSVDATAQRSTFHSITSSQDASQFKAITADSIIATQDGSQLKFLALTDSAPATPAVKTLYEDSIVKAWLDQDGSTTPSVQDDVNIASITDTGIGVRQPVFATNMSTAVFEISVQISNGGAEYYGAAYVNANKATTGYGYELTVVDSITNATEVDQLALSSIIGNN